MPASVVAWAQGSGNHLSRAQAPPRLCQDGPRPPDHQASGRDPEVKQRPEVAPPSPTRPPPSGPGRGAQPAQVPLPWLGTHPGSLRELLCGWSQGTGARGRADEQGEDGRVEPCSPRVPRSGEAAFASDPDSGGAGGGAAKGPGLPPPPASSGSHFSAPGSRPAFHGRPGKLGPAERPAGRIGGSRPPSTRCIRWPITTTDGFQVFPSPLTPVYGTTFNLPSIKRRRLALFSGLSDFNSP